MTTTRTATFGWDPADRAWLVDFPSEPGCHTFGRTLRAAREHAVDALALWLDLPADQVAVDERLDLGDDTLRAAAERARQAREAADRAREDSSHAARDAADLLVHDAGLTYRDAAAVLGVSHQRVAQLVTSTKPAHRVLRT